MEHALVGAKGRLRRIAVFVALVLFLVAVRIGPSWAAPPTHDTFSSAEAITSLPMTASVSNAEATLEDGEPQPTCSAMEATLWYTLVPTEDGTISVDSFGSDHDTVLGVYSGSSLAGLEEVACSDQAPDQVLGESALSFDATAGTTYHIQAGAWWTPGNLTVNVSGPDIGTDPEPSPSASPSSSPSAGPSPSPSASPSASPSPSPSASPSPSPSASPSVSPSPSPSASPNPSPSPSPGPNVTGPIWTTIHSKRPVVDANERFMLYGQVSALSPCGRPFEVEIRKEPRSGPGRSLGSVRTGPLGFWHKYVRSSSTADYTASIQGSACYQPNPDPSTQVKVRAKIRLEDANRCSGPRFVRGSVIPDAPGTFIFMERRTQRGWASIGMDVLDRESRFRMLAPSCDEWYRVRWPSQHEDNLGKIKLFRLRA